MPARAATALAALLLFAGCTAPLPSRMVRLAITSSPHALNPLLAQSIVDNDVLRLIYDPLIAADARGELRPALATVVPSERNGGISRDGRTIVYHLRRDVRWHDGKPFTSADVAASFRAVMDPHAIVPSRRGFDVVERLETPDRWTVRFRLKRRFAPFVATVFSESDSPYYLAPAHLLEGDPVAVRRRFERTPIGTGPFKVLSWKRDDRLELAANMGYWAGAPTYSGIDLRFIPDENTEVTALRAGQIDGILHLGANAAAPLKDDASLHVWTAPVNGYYGLMFQTQRPALRDVRVRRALAEAIDTNGFVDSVAHGMYGAAIGDLPAFLWAADPTLAPIRYDPDDARRLLAAAGYRGGRRLTIDLVSISEFQTHRIGAVFLQALFARVGVEARLHAYRGTLYAAPYGEGGILARGNYDAAIYGWVAGADPDDSGQFLCDQFPPAGYNDSRYCSPEMDAAQRSALDSYDPRARRKAYARIERLLLRDVPIAFLATPAEIFVTSSAIGGVDPSLVTLTANAHLWTLHR